MSTVHKLPKAGYRPYTIVFEYPGSSSHVIRAENAIEWCDAQKQRWSPVRVHWCEILTPSYVTGRWDKTGAHLLGIFTLAGNPVVTRD